MKRIIRGQSVSAVFCIVVAVVLMTGSTAWGEAAGACCDLNGTCHNDIIPDKCSSLYYSFYLGQSCSEVTCPQPGACCTETGCSIILGAMCDNDDGQFAGPETTCDDSICTRGACCNEPPPSLSGSAVVQGMDYPCEMTIKSQCNIGDWNPTCDCTGDTCNPKPGACITGGQCEEVPRIGCFDLWIGGACPSPVPTVNQWGLIIMSLLLVCSAIWFIARRKRTS